MRHLVCGAAILAAIANPALAQQVTLGLPVSAGTACPAESETTIRFSPDGDAIAVTFGGFTVTAGGGEGSRPSDRKLCNIAIPVAVDPGLSVGVPTLVLRGSADLPEGASVLVSVESFFAGGTGPRRNYNFEGPLADDFVLVGGPVAGEEDVAENWSACGADVTLRADPAVRVLSPGGQAGTVTLKDAVILLRFRHCE